MSSAYHAVELFLHYRHKPSSRSTEETPLLHLFSFHVPVGSSKMQRIATLSKRTIAGKYRKSKICIALPSGCSINITFRYCAEAFNEADQATWKCNVLRHFKSPTNVQHRKPQRCDTHTHSHNTHTHTLTHTHTE